MNSNTNRDPIAIIGIGVRLPGESDTPEEFWNMLQNKTDCICDVPADRWDKDALYHPDYTVKNKINVKQGGFIKDIDKWDAGFFGIPPVDAIRMDPQQRLLLENVYYAVEDAGLKLEDLSGTMTGVFIGISAHDYGDLQQAPMERVNLGAHTMQGGASSIASNRISYLFNFHGPSFSVDTACSSSMVGLHQACRSIWAGESTLAFVGGVNAILKPEPEMAFSKGGFLSGDARCKAFDAGANGYIRSEGSGVILLKPLSQAKKDGDDVYAVVLGSAINEDGRTNGLAMPGEKAQRMVLEAAYKDAGLDPAEVDYVEAHGTGTAVGDPIEANSIGEVIGKKKKTGKVILGSVKSNVGHLEPASGMAGIVKLCLALKKRQVPPNIHFKNPNPKIDFEDNKLMVPVEPVSIDKSSEEPIYAGLNSFGFGGANAHIVLASLPDAISDVSEKTSQKGQSSGPFRKGPFLLTLSARSDNALKQLVKDYIRLIKEGNAELYDICYSAADKRSAHDERLAVAGHDKEELLENLNFWLDEESIKTTSRSRAGLKEQEKGQVVFFYSGQGPQWYGMGRELIQTNELFRQTIEKIDEILKKLGWLEEEKSSLIEELSKDESDSRINETEIAQPAIFAVQVALTELWRSYGYNPDAVIGHSIGEVASSWASGALTLEEACRVVFWRSRCQSKAAGMGKMLAVGLSEEQCRKEIQALGDDADKVDIAVINGKDMLTVSGESDAVEDFADILEEKDVFFKFLVVDVPFHSYLLDFVKDEFVSSLGNISTQETLIPLYSTVTASLIGGKELDASYWYRNLREPVYFYSAVKNMAEEGYNTFIEIAPHPILSRNVSDILKETKKKGVSVPSIRRKEPEMKQMLASVGRLYTWGVPADWKKLYDQNPSFIKLPHYPWQKERYWLEREASQKVRMGTMIHPHLESYVEGVHEEYNRVWNILLDKRTDVYIEDHRVQGPLVYPGAGHCELAISCGINSFGKEFNFVEDINFNTALFLPDEGYPYDVRLEITSAEGNYTISSRQREDMPWNIHSNGKINHLGDQFFSETIDMKAVRERCQKTIDLDNMFEQLYTGGLQLGPTFKGIYDLRQGEGESLGKIKVHENIRHGIESFNIHPSLLDASFQTAFGIIGPSKDNLMGVYIPVHIDRIKFHQKPVGSEIMSYARSLPSTPQMLRADIWIYDEKGNLVAEVQNFSAKYLKGSRKEVAGEMDHWFYEYNWYKKSRREDFLRRNPAAYLKAPSVVKNDVQKIIDKISKEPENKIFLNQWQDELDKLTYLYILKSFSDSQVSLISGERYSYDNFLTLVNVIPRHHKLFKQMLNLLTEAGYFRKEGDEYIVATEPDFDPEDKQRDLESRYEMFSQELKMIGRCGPEIKNVLQGNADPVQLLFPENDWDSVVDYYVNAYAFSKYNRISKEVVKHHIKNIPDDKVVRILEVGAGTGGLSQALFDEFPADRTEYVYTDISSMFNVQAKRRFHKYPFVDYRVLNIEEDPKEQGFEPHSFDLIVASDVLHATKDIKRTLSHVKTLLAPEGSLLLLELTNTSKYLDIIFGMTEGWWAYEDYDIRPDHCIMSIETWTQHLQNSGFADIVPFTDVPKCDKPSQTVFFAHGPADVEFAVEDKAAESMAAPGCFVVFADEKGYARQVIDRLKSDGKKVIEVRHRDQFKPGDDQVYSLWNVRTGNGDDIKRVIDAAVSASEPFEGVLDFWPVDACDVGQLTFGALEEDSRLTVLSALEIVKPLLDLKGDNLPQFGIVTTEAAAVSEKEFARLNISQTPLWGFGRVVENEHSSMLTRIFDLSSSIDKNELDQLYTDLFSDQEIMREEEIAYRGCLRYVHKFDRVSKAKANDRATSLVRADGYPFQIASTEFGNLDNIVCRRFHEGEPGEGEVRVAVKATGVNFRDVMMALGMLSEEAVEGGKFGRNFGLECAGVVTKVGPGVSEFKEGDEVIGMGRKSLAGSVTIEQEHVAKKPKGISFAAASTIPIVYLTAYYSLEYICRMQEGETVLVHGGAGGVGIAAIRIAKDAGLTVIATAGNDKKREFCRKTGADYVLNSRALTFRDEIMEITGGRGVDIVINSIAGKAVIQSIRSLAPYGRFVEIGKMDIYGNTRIGLKPFGNNLSYHGVDIDRLLEQKPKLAGKLFRELMEKYFYNNKFPAHPVEEFPITDVIGGFKFMAQSKHIGKVVLNNEGLDIRVSPPSELILEEDASYMIVGGCGGFGLAVGEWMTGKNAKTLILTSRSGVKEAQDQEKVEKMRKNGIRVEIIKADVTKEEGVKSLFDQIQSLPPLKGIINSATLLRDNMFPQQNEEEFMAVIRPKVHGTWLLHEYSKSMDLDFFVMFSSVSAMYGTPAQSNYASANSFLDFFAAYRRGLGLPASTVNWGVLSEVGLVSRDDKINTILASQGWKSFNLNQSTAVLEKVLLEKPVQMGAIDAEWDIVSNMFPHMNRSYKFTGILNDSDAALSSGGESGILDALAGLSDEEKHDFLLGEVKEAVAKVIGASAQKLDETLSITKMGLDSLMANQLRTWISNNTGVDYSLMRIMQGPSIEELTTHLLESAVVAGGTEDGDPGSWLVIPKPQPEAAKRLVLFPYMGAGASVYKTWPDALSEYEVCIVQLPERENRQEMKFSGDVSETITAVCDAVSELSDKPLCFYGHSFGADMAYEIALRLQKDYGVVLDRFYVGSSAAPHVRSVLSDLLDSLEVTTPSEIDDSFVKSLFTKLGLPEDQVENENWFANAAPAFKGDLYFMKKRSDGSENLTCPVTLFTAKKDHVFPEEQQKPWEEKTESSFEQVIFDTTHFFIDHETDLKPLFDHFKKHLS